jgi:hypothetical protein
MRFLLSSVGRGVKFHSELGRKKPNYQIEFPYYDTENVSEHSPSKYVLVRSDKSIFGHDRGRGCSAPPPSLLLVLLSSLKPSY